MKKQLLFFDIDGTLAANDNNNRCFVPESNRKSLRMLKEKGCFLAACTGRQAAFVHELFPDTFKAVVANSGNYVEYEGEAIFKSVIDPERLNHFITVFQQNRICSALVGIEDVYVAYSEERDRERVFSNYREGTRIVFDSDGCKDVLMFDLFFRDEEEYLRIKPYFTEDMTVNVHENILLPADVSLGNNKGTGIRAILDYLGEDCCSYGFGDGFNDIPLIEATDIGIAMGNSVNALKEASDYVTDDIGHDGIYKALLHFGLLEEENESVCM